jgi:dTDP-4-amino-4,6-dideoxygalactose transaminase
VFEKRIFLSPPHLGENEISYIQDAFRSNWITTAGANISQFESVVCSYTGANYGVAVSSGTAAIHLALLLAGVEKGDEVICSSFTFVASANPILYLGATPVFIDSEQDTWNMCPELLEVALKDRIQKGKKPKAIVLVHLYGQPAKLNEILALSQKYEITLIEDAAESLGSTYEEKMTGTFGAMGIYSFNGNKIITTSGGGMLVSNNESFIHKAAFLSAQSREKAIHYQHEVVGFNYRMSNVLAGIGIGQMEVITNRIAKKRALFQYYKNALSGSSYTFLEEQKNVFSNRWLTTVLCKKENPEKISLILEQYNIESRPLWKPLHLQPLFKSAPVYQNGTSEKLYSEGLCLPSGTTLTEEQQDKICALILGS